MNDQQSETAAGAKAHRKLAILVWHREIRRKRSGTREGGGTGRAAVDRRGRAWIASVYGADVEPPFWHGNFRC